MSLAESFSGRRPAALIALLAGPQHRIVSAMAFSSDWNELDRLLWRVQKDTSVVLPFFRSLLSAELDVLMPYQNELEGEMLKVENGAPFPFALFDSPQGKYVVAFTSPERADEGMKAGKVAPDTFLSCVVNGRDLCEMVGVMQLALVVNKSCQTGEYRMNDVLLRDLANGEALRSTHPDHTEHMTLHQVDPAHYPTDIIQAAFQKMRQHSAFRAAWLLAQHDEKEWWYVLMTYMNPPSDQLRHELDLVVQLARSKSDLGVRTSHLDLDNRENVIGAFRQFPTTFYTAPGFDPAKPFD
jgi:hypothetical protein